MKRIEFLKEDLSILPLPNVGYKTIGIDSDGFVKTIDDQGNIEGIGGSGGGATEVGTGTDSIQQVGVGASAQGLSALALGSGATTIAGDDPIAIGRNSNANAERMIAIGLAAAGTGTDAVSIGALSDANGNQSVALGKGAQSAAIFSIAIGNLANASSESSSIAIGNGATSNERSNIALGVGAIANNRLGVSIGSQMQTSANGAIMLGASFTTRTNSTAYSFEVNLDEATSTVRIGKSVDSWINTSANFGIGLNTGINAKLHVGGDTQIDGGLVVNGSPSSYTDYKVSGTTKTQIGFLNGSGSGFLYTPSATDFEFWIGGPVRGTYFSNGNLKIGTGSDNGYKLEVSGTTLLDGDTIVNAGQTRLIGGDTSGTSSVLLTQDFTGAQDLFDVRNNGDIYTNGNKGFTGTGAYTNFTIVNGLITAAS